MRDKRFQEEVHPHKDGIDINYYVVKSSVNEMLGMNLRLAYNPEKAVGIGKVPDDSLIWDFLTFHEF